VTIIQSIFCIIALVFSGLFLISIISILLVVAPGYAPEERSWWYFLIGFESLWIATIGGSALRNLLQRRFSLWPSILMIVGYAITGGLIPFSIWGLILLIAEKRRQRKRDWLRGHCDFLFALSREWLSKKMNNQNTNQNDKPQPVGERSIFLPTGRINRVSYGLRMAIIFAAYVAVGMIQQATIGREPNLLVKCISYLLFAFVVVTTIKRLHDLGYGAVAVIFLGPIVPLLLFASGEPNANAYGFPPLSPSVKPQQQRSPEPQTIAKSK
jgi:uncharacterized membrane protein YhaH (DUF805 family)